MKIAVIFSAQYVWKQIQSCRKCEFVYDDYRVHNSLLSLCIFSTRGAFFQAYVRGGLTTKFKCAGLLYFMSLDPRKDPQ
jgi:hypothetical protein